MNVEVVVMVVAVEVRQLIDSDEWAGKRTKPGLPGDVFMVWQQKPFGQRQNNADFRRSPSHQSLSFVDIR